jgi:hypothetical protein
MKTLLIAMGGIRVGAIRPLELATDGLLEVLEKPDLPGGFGCWAIPCLPHPNIKPKKNCVIQLETGCRLSAKSASPKVRISSSFDDVGCQGDDDLEVYLMAIASYELITGESFL